MPDQSEQKYLKLEQYKDANQLNTRIQLHQRFSTNPYGWCKWVFDQFVVPSQAAIFEIGCGPGTLWLDNQGRIPPGWQVTLSDFSSGMVREARRNLAGAHTIFRFETSDGMAIPFPEKTFDAVIANHMIYHFIDRKKGLEEMSRVLKPKGHFYATTIGEDHLKELSHIMAGFKPTSSHYYSPALNPTGFTLQNGTPQLAPWFDKIEIHHYPDALVVTEAAPLVAYIVSMISGSQIKHAKHEIDNLSDRINKMIIKDGSIFIHKSSGIFIGEKRN